MSSFREHYIEDSIAVNITDTDVGRSIGRRLKLEATIVAWEARDLFALMRLTLHAHIE